MKKSKESFQKAWAKVVARAWTDEEFKQKLVKNPEKVLKDMGISIPEGVKLELHVQTNKTMHLILPDHPRDLSEKEMKNIAGAWTTFPWTDYGG